MKKFVGCLKFCLIFFVTIVFFSSLSSKAYEIGVIYTNVLDRPINDGYFFTETSKLLSLKLVNHINSTQDIHSSVISDFSQLDTYTKSKLATFLKNYEHFNTYDMETLKKISYGIGKDNILLVSTSVDVQSRFLQPCVWNKLGITGGDSVKPQYVLRTSILLVNPKSEKVLYDGYFNKKIQANNLDLSVSGASNSKSELEKINKYCVNLAENLCPLIEYRVRYQNVAKDDSIPPEPIIAPAFVNSTRTKGILKYREFQKNQEKKRLEKQNKIEDL